MTVRRLLSLAAGEALDEKTCCNLLSSVGLCAMEYIDREADATLSGGEMKADRDRDRSRKAAPDLQFSMSRRRGSTSGVFSMLIKTF